MRVQTGGHRGFTLIKVHSLVSLLWILTMSWFCSPPGIDSPLVSDVSLMGPLGEILERLAGRRVGTEGTHWVVGIFEWDM